MVEATISSGKPRTARPAGFSADLSKLELPKFEMPKFELPKMEVPAAFRDAAERSISQMKAGYERIKTAAEEATDVMEETYATASRGATDYNLKLIEIARTNTNAAFDFSTELLGARSLADVIEWSTAYMRRQFDALSEQSKELVALAQRVATETSEPIKEGVNKAMKEAA